jgi:hypothetical protein
MSIPLDRLYHYIENIAEDIYGDAVIIYRFYPNGSKKLEDLIPLKYISWTELSLIPGIYCNDQEPLNSELYENYEFKWTDKLTTIFKSLNIKYNQHNLRHTPGIYDNVFLLHSERRSKNLETYQQNQYITVYYWNHALLALDWFRYAEYAVIKQTPTKKFLIYNRAWAGTREYRLKFADLLIDYKLVNQCQTSIAFYDQNIYYKNHQFNNIKWQPHHRLENYFDLNNTPSTSSADFTIEDYENTDIEVVLETLFDDDRLHLTEKSLRPIACGQPFILAATHGSLKYIRSYGFKTFDNIIDESYDLIQDPARRLQAIVLLMQQIANWTDDERHYKMSQLQQIAEFNRKHFFSSKFFNQVITELKENLSIAFTEFKNTKSSNHWLGYWNELLPNRSVQDFLESNQDIVFPTTHQFNIVYKEAIKYSTLRIPSDLIAHLIPR